MILRAGWLPPRPLRAHELFSAADYARRMVVEQLHPRLAFKGEDPEPDARMDEEQGATICRA